MAERSILWTMQTIVAKLFFKTVRMTGENGGSIYQHFLLIVPSDCAGDGRISYS